MCVYEYSNKFDMIYLKEVGSENIVYYEAFHQNQPNNTGNEQHFLLISDKGFWNDSSEKCESNGVYVMGYICEWLDTEAPK